MISKIHHNESLSFLTFDDEYLIDILGNYHGLLFIQNKEHFFCNAMMMYLEIDENNIVHVCFNEKESNIIVTANHCLEKLLLSNIKF